MSAPTPRPSRPRARRAAPLLAALLIAALAAPVQAQWVWRDRDGQVNASDRPPPRDVADKDILSRPEQDPRRIAQRAAAAASGAASAAPAPADRELQARKRNAEQEQAAKSRADEERLSQQRAENCRAARSHISALESGQRIARINDKGEREIIDDLTRADDLRRARSVIASDCR